MNTALNITTLSDVVKINCAEKSISRFGLSYIVKNDMYYLRLKDNLNFKGSKQTLREKIVERFNRVEIPYLIYNALISTIDRNGSSDCSFFGGAKHIIKRIYKATGIKITEADFKKNLNRLAESEMLTVQYNNLLHEYRNPNHYKGLPDGYVIRPGISINQKQEHYRMIYLNMEMLNNACSVVDLKDEYYLNANTRIRKFIKRRNVFNLDLISKKFSDIRHRIKTTGNNKTRSQLSFQIASPDAAVAKFIKEVSSKYYSVMLSSPKNVVKSLYVGKSEEYWIDDDTGEVIPYNLTPEKKKVFLETMQRPEPEYFDEEQSKILDDIFRNIQ